MFIAYRDTQPRCTNGGGTPNRWIIRGTQFRSPNLVADKIRELIAATRK